MVGATVSLFRLVFVGERRRFFRVVRQRLFQRVAAFMQGDVGLFVAVVGFDLRAHIGKWARLWFFAFGDGKEQGTLRRDFDGARRFCCRAGLVRQRVVLVLWRRAARGRRRCRR